MQWQSNIMQLKSQLLLVESVVQAKDATIQANNATINSLRLTNYELMDKATKAELEKSKSEYIIPGVVSVSTVKAHGVAVNLAEVV